MPLFGPSTIISNKDFIKMADGVIQVIRNMVAVQTSFDPLENGHHDTPLLVILGFLKMDIVIDNQYTLYKNTSHILYCSVKKSFGRDIT